MSAIPFGTNVVGMLFDDTEKSKVRAGSLAFERAIGFGYSRTAAAALRRTAKREHYPNRETPEQTARRIVGNPGTSSTTPRGAA